MGDENAYAIRESLGRPTTRGDHDIYSPLGVFVVHISELCQIHSPLAIKLVTYPLCLLPPYRLETRTMLDMAIEIPLRQSYGEKKEISPSTEARHV